MANISVRGANCQECFTKKALSNGTLFQGLQPGTIYNVTLSFLNTNTHTIFSLKKEAKTQPAKLENLTQVGYPNGLLQVTWEKTDAMKRAECHLLGSDEAPFEVSTFRCAWFFGSKDIVWVHGVNVTVFNDWGNESFGSLKFNYLYVPENISNVIQSATVTSVSSTSANITVVESPDAGDDVTAYAIRDGATCFMFQRTTSCEKPEQTRCRPGEAVLMAKRPEADDDNTTTVVLVTDNLQPSTNYTFKVIPLLCNVIKNGTKQYLEQFTTLFEVTNLTATAEGTRVRVDWDSPQAPADVNYTVYIEDKVHVTPENNCPFKGERKTVLCQIEADGAHGNCSGDVRYGFWEYDVTVVANTNGDSVSANSTVTTGATAPGKVSTLNVKTWNETDTCGVKQRTNRSFVCVTWQELCPRDRNSFIGHYRLVLNGNNEDQDQTLKKESSLHRYNDSTAQEYRRDAHLTEYNVWLYAKPNHTFQLTIRPVTIHGTEGPESTLNFGTPDVPKPVVPNITEIEQNVPKDKINSTQTTIQFVVKSSKFLSEDKDGNPVDTVVLVTSAGTKPKVYDKSEDYDKYPGWANRTEALENGGYRISEDTLNRLGSGPLTVTVGDEVNCTSSQDKYCDGALEAGKTYSVWVSLCNEAHCVRVLLVANQSTAATPNMDEGLPVWKLGSILFGVFAGVILIIVLLCCTAFRDKMQVSSRTQDLSEWGTEMDGLKNRPLKRPMKLMTLESVISKKQRDDFMLLRDEFEDLCMITRTKKIPNTASLMDINLSKNRYADILAYDHSRVKLTADDEGSDYINANFVPGYNREDEYVACQGPLPYTVGDFWRMVWEHRMPIIVMLTQPKEKGKIKCEQYWPAERGEEMEYDNMKVTNISVSNVNDYNITIFSISNMLEESEPFEVVHFHHLTWPDMTADISLESMIEFLTVVRQHVRPDKPGPMVVHCSAGVGRTGTFISIDYAMQFISQRPIKDELDIFGFILRMRQSRGKMIQTEDQYIFIHQCARFLMAERRRRESEGTGNGKRCLPHASSTTSIDSARGDSRCSLQNGDLEELALEAADMDTVELDTNEDLPRSYAEAGDVEMSVYDMTAYDDGPISASSTENLCVP
ncbi:receptor-type tyrosine-protein phosphatase eta-like [Littorina saxatilis]